MTRLVPSNHWREALVPVLLVGLFGYLAAAEVETKILFRAFGGLAIAWGLVLLCEAVVDDAMAARPRWLRLASIIRSFGLFFLGAGFLAQSYEVRGAPLLVLWFAVSNPVAHSLLNHGRPRWLVSALSSSPDPASIAGASMPPSGLPGVVAAPSAPRSGTPSPKHAAQQAVEADGRRLS